MIPKIIKGGAFSDDRGSLKHNNTFDASFVKRIYTIKNAPGILERAWQGHRIEQRWFSSVKGSFIIKLIKIDNWDHPSKNLEKIEFQIDDTGLDVLHIPPGYISSIISKEPESILLVMADYSLHEIKDEYKFPNNYF